MPVVGASHLVPIGYQTLRDHTRISNASFCSDFGPEQLLKRQYHRARGGLHGWEAWYPGDILKTLQRCCG
jgi:hypothetical protein